MFCVNINVFSASCICILYFYMLIFVHGQSKTSSEYLSSEFYVPKINKTGQSEINEVNEASSENIPSHSENNNQDDQDLFKILQQKGLYYSLPPILEDINNNKLESGIVDLMSVHNRSEWISKMRENYQARDQIKKKKRMIFINIETVYNSKREMIVKALSRRFRGKHMTSPPKFMADIRIIVGKGVARKLYYSITKYSTAVHVKQALSTQAVILEKYWLHHAAFILSKVFNETELPPRGHPIYKWPKDLLPPDVLFFVNATKHVGEATGFYQEYTPFTDRLIQVFRRVEGVKVVELNPSLKYQTIVRSIVTYVNEHFKDNPDISLPSALVTSRHQQRIQVER